MRTLKRFAQHWLRDESVLDKIVRAGELKASDRCLEIGPGTGNLTSRLLQLVGGLVAVEIDRDLCQHLVKKFGQKDNFLLLQGDFLELEINSTLTDFPKFQNPNKVLANIPYNITGPILEKLLGTITNPAPNPYELIVLLVQKEIADRLISPPGSRQFGALSVRVQYLAQCELICPVPARSFSPVPKVDSAVIRIRPRLSQLPPHNPRRLETILKLGFASKRKMLRNNLKSLIESDRLSQLLEQLSLDPQARAEEIGVDNWLKLCNLIEVELKAKS